MTTISECRSDRHRQLPSYLHSVTIFLRVLLTHSNEADLEFQSERAYRAVK